jgi:hypothetical protein
MANDKTPPKRPLRWERVKVVPVIFCLAARRSLPSRLGDKKRLMYKDATAKSVRLDILTKVPKTILFCITLT